LSPINWVVFVRSGDRRWSFRTTDFDVFNSKVDPLTGMVEVNATSVVKKLKLHLRVQSTVNLSGFSPPLYIPTASGFSNTPGCRETYTAMARITLEEGWGTISQIEKSSATFDLDIPLSSLEFGGSFLQPIVKS
jgi:hypothetical protein